MLLVPEDGPTKMGTAMMALAPRRRAFVMALFQAGTNNHAEAARIAGYKDTPAVRQQAYLLVRDEKVQAAIREEAKRQNVANVPFALRVVEDVAAGAADPKRLRAAERILNTAGILEEVAVQRVEGNISVAVTHENKNAMIEDIRRMALEMGVDPKTLLGKVVDLDASEYSEERINDEYTPESMADLL